MASTRGPAARAPTSLSARRGAARLGARVAIVARLGDDEFGRRALPFWHAEGIDFAHAAVATGEANAVASILVADDGENSIAVFRGAGYRLTAAQVRAARPVFDGAAIVALPLELQDEAVGATLRLARECGARTVLNPAPARALPDAWLPLVDVLTPNALEARQLCGLPATPPCRNSARHCSTWASAESAGMSGLERLQWRRRAIERTLATVHSTRIAIVRALAPNVRSRPIPDGRRPHPVSPMQTVGPCSHREAPSRAAAAVKVEQRQWMPIPDMDSQVRAAANLRTNAR